MSIKVYVAAPWTEKAYAKQVTEQLREAGLEPTNRWVDFPGDSSDPSVLQAEAINDRRDVKKANALFLLNLQPRGSETSGKAVETGLALAWGKKVVMMGENSNIFHSLPEVIHVNSVEEAIAALTSEVNHASRS